MKKLNYKMKKNELKAKWEKEKQGIVRVRAIKKEME